MKLTKKAKKLLKQSINHWNKDIKEEVLKLDDKIGEDNFCFKDSAGYCSLCSAYIFGSSGSCSRCPYYLFYGYCCDARGEEYIKNNGNTYYRKRGHWQRWINNKSLKTCNGMIKALEKILNESE